MGAGGGAAWAVPAAKPSVDKAKPPAASAPVHRRSHDFCVLVFMPLRIPLGNAHKTLLADWLNSNPAHSWDSCAVNFCRRIPPVVTLSSLVRYIVGAPRKPFCWQREIRGDVTFHGVEHASSRSPSKNHSSIGDPGASVRHRARSGPNADVEPRGRPPRVRSHAACVRMARGPDLTMTLLVAAPPRDCAGPVPSFGGFKSGDS
jgi:hypothetical protein